MSDKNSDTLTVEDKVAILEEWIRNHEFLPEIIGNYNLTFFKVICHLTKN